jgi:phage N-6-adenine-methyltransferase
MKVHFSSSSGQWSTPQDLFNELNDEFNFDLDACAREENHKVKFYFSDEVLYQGHHSLSRSALIHPWNGNIFINPPYGRTIKKFIKRAVEQVKIGNAEIVVALLPARTDTAWFHDYCKKQDVTFLKGRLKFGGAKNSAPFPSMIVKFFKE